MPSAPGTLRPMAPLAEGQRRQIVELYRQSKKTAEITAQTGAARSTIYFVLKEEGVVPSRRSGRRHDVSIPRGTELPPSEHTRLLDWALTCVAELERENERLRTKLESARRALE